MPVGIIVVKAEIQKSNLCEFGIRNGEFGQAGRRATLRLFAALAKFQRKDRQGSKETRRVEKLLGVFLVRIPNLHHLLAKGWRWKSSAILCDLCVKKDSSH